MKALLVANTTWYLYNFRRPLARALRASGVEPIFVAPTDKYTEKLQQEGFRCVDLEMRRDGMNPLAEFFTLLRFVKIYASERPDAVHHFTIKCVIYGGIAASLLHVKGVINAVTGLGHVFISKAWYIPFVRPLVLRTYRWLFRRQNARVVFQNQDDLEAFRALDVTTPAQVALIRSSGVNLKRFDIPISETTPPIALFAARLLVEKGVHEFVEAARILRHRGVQVRFQLAGEPDPGNPSSIGETDLKKWSSAGEVELLGHIESIEHAMASAAIVVLPSYREGLPKVLLEASALRKPVVATRVPGCREAVLHGETGLLVSARDAEALADAIGQLVADPELRHRMGQAGRVFVEKEFSEERVVSETLKLYRGLGTIVSTPGLCEP